MSQLVEVMYFVLDFILFRVLLEWIIIITFIKDDHHDDDDVMMIMIMIDHVDIENDDQLLK